MTHRTVNSPWGWLAVVGDGRTVRAIVMAYRTKSGVRRQLRASYPDARTSTSAYPALCRQLEAYFGGRPVEMSAPVDLRDLSAFHQRVLRACRTIPFGRVLTYAELAARAGRASAVRAVGGALARNPVPLVIPCHRVVRSDGLLGGFSAAGGVALKRRLLAHEGLAIRRGRLVARG